MNRKYPTSLFIIGFMTNIVGKFLYLFFPAVILLIVGIWVKVCLMLGGALLGLDVILSLIEQLKIRHTVLHTSDDPNFREFQDALLSDDWQSNVKNIVEDKIRENQTHDGQDKK